MENINLDLEKCFHDDVNSYGTGVSKVTTKYGELTEPWHIQALTQEKCDIIITVDISGTITTFTTKVKSVINMDYPDRHWFTLVMDVKIDDEIMEAWFTDKFYEEGHKYIMFYPKSRLPRLNAEIMCRQIEKIKQLKLQVEALTGKTIEELATEPQAMVVTLADISKEAGWDCYNCAAKGGEWCDELQMALYGGCPMFEMK